ncbi:MAG: efflux RND transporter periplasmic adaptor subunit [Candidatus Cryptobacteroides sp.]
MKKTNIIISFALAIVSCTGNRPEMREQTLKTMVVSTTDRMLFSEYSASVKGRQDVDIYPQISGKITEILIDEGAVVRKGQPLFIIDQVPYKSAAEIAKSNLKSAEAQLATEELSYESKQSLYEEKVISEYELRQAGNSLNSARAALSQARAQLDKAENELSYTVVKSPVNGRSGMINYRTGAYVGPNSTSPLVSVSDNEYMHIYFSMSEKQMLSITAGNTLEGIGVELSLSDGSGYGHTGKIDAVSGIIDSRTGSVTIRASFPNPEGRLKSGGSAIIRIPHNMDKCIVIPKEATFEIQDKIFIYKIVDGVTKAFEISVFPVSSDQEYIVTDGLEAGDRIVSSGAGLVREGQRADSSEGRAEI